MGKCFRARSGISGVSRGGQQSSTKTSLGRIVLYDDHNSWSRQSGQEYPYSVADKAIVIMVMNNFLKKSAKQARQDKL